MIENEFTDLLNNMKASGGYDALNNMVNNHCSNKLSVQNELQKLKLDVYDPQLVSPVLDFNNTCSYACTYDNTTQAPPLPHIEDVFKSNIKSNCNGNGNFRKIQHTPSPKEINVSETPVNFTRLINDVICKKSALDFLVRQICIAIGIAIPELNSMNKEDVSLYENVWYNVFVMKYNTFYFGVDPELPIDDTRKNVFYFNNCNPLYTGLTLHYHDSITDNMIERGHFIAWYRCGINKVPSEKELEYSTDLNFPVSVVYYDSYNHSKKLKEDFSNASSEAQEIIKNINPENDYKIFEATIPLITGATKQQYNNIDDHTKRICSNTCLIILEKYKNYIRDTVKLLQLVTKRCVYEILYKSNKAPQKYDRSIYDRIFGCILKNRPSQIIFGEKESSLILKNKNIVNPTIKWKFGRPGIVISVNFNTLMCFETRNLFQL